MCGQLSTIKRYLKKWKREKNDHLFNIFDTEFS